MSLPVAERAKAFRDRRSAEQESACQTSTSNAATAVDSLMDLRIEMRSAGPDKDVDEPTGPVGAQLCASELCPSFPPLVNYGSRNGPLATNTSILCF
jgi:hypothetical protein